MQNVIRDTRTLLQHAGLDDTNMNLPEASIKEFPVRVPDGFIKKVQKACPDDPLLRQVLPLPEEDRAVAGFSHDPLQETGQLPVPGILRKYHGRALLLTTGACAIHCRYCFRRHFPYKENNPAQDNWQAALDVIRSDTSIHEVILSGGDPLALSDEKLAKLIVQLQDITHLKRLRIHTRMPVVLPSRISDALLILLASQSLQTVMVIHANHPHEIDEEVMDGLTGLIKANVILFNQSVLLHKVNDDADVLVELSEKLFDARVLPYYLHQLDPVAGSSHFQVEAQHMRHIMEQLRTRLPGYLVPRMVREEAGAPYKIPVL